VREQPGITLLRWNHRVTEDPLCVRQEVGVHKRNCRFQYALLDTLRCDPSSTAPPQMLQHECKPENLTASFPEGAFHQSVRSPFTFGEGAHIGFEGCSGRL
jgi:hypothetical protein